MEQERVTLIIIISTIIVMVFSTAIIVFFIIYQNLKNKLLINNKSLRDIIRNKLPTFKLE